MEIIGYLSALLIGLSLGLTGSGGSILMLPILVYLFRIEMIQATAYSLFIVGITSLVGVKKYIDNRSIELKSSLIFGIPSLLMVAFTRRYIVPQIPEYIILSDTLSISRHFILMTFFALLMIIASLRFIKQSSTQDSPKQGKNYRLGLAISGIIVGFLTGILGIGGGFLIVPVLVSFLHLDMKKAVGTSLLLIVLNSLIGFLSESHFQAMDWKLLVIITLISIVGMFIGSGIVRKIRTEQLKKIFGWFILCMGIIILFKETIVYLH